MATRFEMIEKQAVNLDALQMLDATHRQARRAEA